MDPRFNNNTILNKRVKEWTHDNVKDHVTKIFKNIELCEGWKFVDCHWTPPAKTKRSEELKRHILSILKITIKDPNEKEFVYDIQIPELIKEQFFYIGGNLKVPIFQIYDYPIIYRTGVLKFHNNIITLTILLNKNNDDGYKVSLFNKTVPLDLLVATYHTKEEFKDFLSTRTNESLMLAGIEERCNDVWDKTTQNERILSLGKIFATPNIDKTKKGKSVLFSLKSAFEVDFFSREFCKTKSMLFELLNAIYETPRSDTDLKLKRIRFEEYILASLMRKVYDMLITLNSSKKVKFQINQTIVTDSCNVSDIVHFNFPINPVGEIASLMQCSLTGPGGFKKDNVPANLRNLDPSHFGRLCTADTPDRDGCGVVTNMVPTINIEENGDFGEIDDKVVTSYPISFTPFLEHDDPIRLQMASNQLKQAILLTEGEKPIIKSGAEDCYLEHSTFLNVAKDSGVVVHIDNQFMIVLYNNKKSEVFKLYWKSLHLNTIDYILPKFKEGEKFKKDDILAESCCLDNGETSFGRNLCTGISIWKGYNYEDGIVLNETTAKKFESIHSVDLTFTIEPGQVLLSLNNDDYNPIPSIGHVLKKGDVFAKIKSLDGEDGFESINIEPYELNAPADCEITDIEIYPNSWNKRVTEFNEFIEHLIIRQTDKYVTLYNKLRTYMNKEQADQFIIVNGLSKLDCASRVGKYSFKGSKFGGIYIKMQAVYRETLGIGDKIANRHGNKGVISKIYPDDEMPSLADGRKLDLILNPLGIISRMNVGQLYELHLNECLYHLKIKLKSLSKAKQVSHLTKFLKIVDKSDKSWITNKILGDFKSSNNNIDELYLIQPMFQSIGPKELEKAIKFSGASYKYTITDSTNNVESENPVSVGYLYFLKLVHRASDKMSARSIGPYSKKTLQPLGGKSKQGGHRLGEMEVWATMGHGAKNLLKDFLTVQSDSPGLKNELLADILQNPELIISDNLDKRPQSLRLLEAYLKNLNLNLVDPDNPIIKEQEQEEVIDNETEELTK